MKPKYRWQNVSGSGRRVSATVAAKEGGCRPEDNGDILSGKDVRALNACCRRRGIRTGNLSAQYTEIDGVRFE